MNIQKSNTATNFRSGLTRKLIKDIKNTDIVKNQTDFAQIGIDADFNGSKSICANFVLTANILAEIAGKFKLPFDFLPPAIKVYEKKDLINKSDNAVGFCITDTKSVLKNCEPFIGGSIFINKQKNGLWHNEFYSDFERLMNWRASSHFLSGTLHEWFHCIHQNLIFKQKGYEGDCPILREQYYKKNANGLQSIDIQTNLPNLPEARILEKLIGRYAANSRSMMEVFAELMTQMTVKSLDKDLNIIKNPLDNLPKDLPAVYKKKVEKILNV